MLQCFLGFRILLLAMSYDTLKGETSLWQEAVQSCCPMHGDSGEEDDGPEIRAVPICNLVKHPKGCDTKSWGLRYQDQAQTWSDAMSARLLDLATRPKGRRRKVRRLKQDLCPVTLVRPPDTLCIRLKMSKEFRKGTV